MKTAYFTLMSSLTQQTLRQQYHVWQDKTGNKILDFQKTALRIDKNCHKT